MVFFWLACKNQGTLDPNTLENYGRTALTTFEAGFLWNILNCVTAVEQRDLQKQMFLPVNMQQLEWGLHRQKTDASCTLNFSGKGWEEMCLWAQISSIPHYWEEIKDKHFLLLQ